MVRPPKLAGDEIRMVNDQKTSQNSIKDLFLSFKKTGKGTWLDAEDDGYAEGKESSGGKNPQSGGVEV